MPVTQGPIHIRKSPKAFNRRFRRKTGYYPGMVKWVGKAGFTRGVQELVKKGIPLENAKRIVGRAKGLARRKGWLEKKHR